MEDLNSITEYLRNNISYKRYLHSINVSAVAGRLAGQYGCDTGKAILAGLVHDCARESGMEALLEYIAAEGIEADELTLSVRELLHGPAAVHMCRVKFGIDDEEVLEAVRYHTTGKENMSLLDKIIYLSDFIEPLRDFEGVEQIREMAYKDLNSALLLAFDSSIKYIMSKKGLIHTDTILSRNYLIRENRERLGSLEVK